MLLKDVMVVCPECKRNVKANDYDIHCCAEVTKQDLQLVAEVVHNMIDATEENYIQIPTGGTVR